MNLGGSHRTVSHPLRKAAKSVQKKVRTASIFVNLLLFSDGWGADRRRVDESPRAHKVSFDFQDCSKHPASVFTVGAT